MAIKISSDGIVFFIVGLVVFFVISILIQGHIRAKKEAKKK